MINTTRTTHSIASRRIRLVQSLNAIFFAALITLIAGCGTSKKAAKKDEFFTSGSREADQRASQRMASDEQLTGSGEGAGEKGVKKAVAFQPGEDGQDTKGINKAAQVEGKLTLFDRLGGAAGITAVVDDFTTRALQDPRVNWQREDVKGTLSLLHKGSSARPWKATDENVAYLKQHLIQFFVLATGRPVHYDGKEMK